MNAYDRGFQVGIWLLVALTVVFTLPGQGFQSPLDQELGQLAVKSKFPGFSVALVSKDKVLYQNGFGWRDMERKLPFTTHTIQPVGSISKTLIGVALLKAVEQGHFTLETPINEVLPFAVNNPHALGKPIKIRHLATHTAGILDRTEVYEKTYEPGTKPSLALKDFLAAYLTEKGRLYRPDNFAKTEPGAAFAYSNIGAALAASLIEAKSGMSYADYTRKFIFEPLQMNESGWVLDEKHPENAKLYNPKNQPHPTYCSITYPDGGLRTSVHDLAKFLMEIIKGYAGESKLLKKESFQVMLTPQFASDRMPKNIDPKEPNQGIFWQFRRNGGIGHSGGDPGVTAFLVFNPKTGTGRIFMTNVGIEEDKAAEQYVAQFGAIWKTLEAYETKLGAF